MYKATRLSVALGLVFGIAAWLGQAPPARGADEPVEVRRARQLFEAEKETILFFAHPTTTLQSLRYDGHRALADGHVLTYTFNWEGASGNLGYSELSFVCDRNGRLDFIRVGDSSAVFFKPFTASNLIVDALKKEVQKDPKFQNDRALMKLLDKDAKAIAEAYLKRDVEALLTLFKALK